MKSIILKADTSKKPKSWFKILTEANNYTVIIWLMVLACFLNSFNLSLDYDFDKSFYTFITVPFYVLLLMLFIFYSTNKVINYLEKNYSLSIRLNNKKRYIKEIIKVASLSNFLIFIIYLIISVAFVTINSSNFLVINMVEGYNISLLLYDAILLVKYFVIIDFLAIFGFLLYKFFSKNVAYVFYIFSCMVYYNGIMSVNLVNGFHLKDLWLFNYLNGLFYTSLTNDIVNFVIATAVYYLLIQLGLYLGLKYKKIGV